MGRGGGGGGGGLWLPRPCSPSSTSEPGSCAASGRPSLCDPISKSRPRLQGWDTANPTEGQAQTQLSRNEAEVVAFDPELQSQSLKGM